MAVVNRRARTTRRVATVLTALAAVFVSACADEKSPAAPVLPGTGPVSEFKPLSFIADVNTRTGEIRITAPTKSTADAPNLSVGGEQGPALSLLGGEAVRLIPSNYTASAVGAFEPNRVRVTFDVIVENKLPGVSFITPTWPTAPAAGVVLFPLDYVVTTTPGGVTGGDGNEVIVEQPSYGEVNPSIDWNGSGAAGSGAPFSFFNDADCGLSTSNDCFRWEAYDETILPLATSSVRRIGFDIDASVGQFRVRMIAAADLAAAGPITPGSVQGTVSSPVRGALENATVSVSGNGSDATDATGAYVVAGVNPGTRTVSVSNLPAGCSAVADQSVSVASGAASTVDFVVTCTGLPGTIGGIITRSNDGSPLDGVTVTSSAGGSDVTDAAGAYSIAGVAAGAGTLTITGAPAECTPAPEAYTMTSAGSITEDIIVSCVAPPTPGYQYNTTWTALPGNQVQLDIRIDMRTFDRADIVNVTTAGALGGTGDPLAAAQLSFTYDASKLTFVEEATALMGAPRLSSGPTVNGTVPGQVTLLNATIGATFFTGNVGIVRIIFDRVPGSVGAVGTVSTITNAGSRTGGSPISVLPNVINTEGTFILP